MRKITILLAFLFFIGSQLANAQTRTISGKVTSSEDGMGIPGVTIQVKNTTRGTTTDIDGNFSMDVQADDATLVFSYVGMNTYEAQIGDQSVINVTLEPSAEALEEVVVTALGISREKKTLGYAVQEVDGEELSRVRETNFVNSLSGRVAGVNVRQSASMGGSANVIIRGTTSLVGNNQALFVVDGVPVDNGNSNMDRPVANSTATNQNDGWGGYDYGNNAMDINPDDIENVSVLKGAAATALYGSRAANGVILITTKKGKAGVGKKGIGITINSGVQILSADMSTAPQWQDQYGGGYGPFYEDPTANFFYADLTGDGNMDLIAPTSEDASWGAKFDPNLMVIQWDALDPLKDNYAEKRPWVAGENDLSYFFQNGVKWTNSVAFDGANEKGNYRLSYTNVDEKGMLVNSSLKKNTVNFGGSYNFTDKFTVSSSMTYVNTKGKGRAGTGYDGLNPMQSLGQWFQRNVDMKRLEDSWLRSDGSQLSWNSSYYDDLHPIYFDNPYWVRHKNYQTDERNRLFGFVGAEYKFTDYLSLNGRMSLDYYGDNQDERIAVGSVDPSYYSNFTRTFMELNYDLNLRFNKTFGDFSVAAMLGSTFRQNTYKRQLSETVGGLVVPDLYSIKNSVSPARITEHDEVWGMNSVFGNASVGYKNFAYLEGTYRWDQSSTLPEDDNSFGYYGVSLSFLLTELNGLNDVSWLSYLKLRGGYAEVGNDTRPYRIYNTYSQNTSWGDNALFSVNSTSQNPLLIPERTKGLEFGLDVRFFNSRLNFDVSRYDRDSENQILDVVVSPMSGITRRWVNGGVINNKGWEIAASGTPVKTKDWNWDLGVNWWTNKSKVESLYDNVDNMEIYSAWDVSINHTVGEETHSIRGTDFVYKDGKKVVDENGYYLRTANDTVIGNVNPDWNMGIFTNLSWKGISLYALVDIQQGGDIYSINTKYGQATGLYEETAGLNDKGNPIRDLVADGGGILFENTVFEDGTPNDQYVEAYRWGRAFYYNNSPTARYVFDASYVKLREVSLSYSLPQSVIGKSPFTNVTFSFIARNLWIIHKNTDHFDPEASLSSGNQQGIETGSYPTARSFGFNIKLGI